MAYFTIEDFAAGMDVRKSASTAASGSLRLLKNAFVNPGGEIEKRQAFYDTAPAPVNSVGLMSSGVALWAVSTDATTMPGPGVIGRYQLTGLPGGVGIAELLDWELYSGKFYTCIRGSDGIIYNHWDGVLVPPDGSAIPVRGTSAKTFKSKMFRTQGQHLGFSAVGNPIDNTGVGRGMIDLAAEDADMVSLKSIEVYYDKLAVFSDVACQIWSMSADPNASQLYQTLRQAGVVSPRSVRQYGSGDVLYLSQDGVRSLKAREQLLTASVTDIGSPMDPYVRALLRDTTQQMDKMIAVLEPANGRFWLVGYKTILVLANYPNPKISAWCIFDPVAFGTAFNPVGAAVVGSLLYIRGANDRIYVYGSPPGSALIFDTTQAEAELPFLHFKKPATFKQFKAVDVSCQGPWNIAVAFNPTYPTNEEPVGVASGPTFQEGQFAMMGHSTHCSLRFRTTDASQCLLSSIMMHYDETTTT